VGSHYFIGYNEYDRRRRLATFHQLWFVARGRLYECREVTVHERDSRSGAGRCSRSGWRW